jgi:uncharacterized protein (TIGR00730 family)
MTTSRVCVFCASSRKCDAVYVEAAREMGAVLARAGLTVLTGGGATGLMGAVAEGTLEAGGCVEGIMPRFMTDKELAHAGLTTLHMVEAMHDRLNMMLERSDAFVALPGGCGTLEEIFYVLTRKRLGQCAAPMVIVNVRGYFDPCLAMLERCVEQGFMDARHAGMWTVVSTPGEVPAALRGAAAWGAENAAFAVP